MVSFLISSITLIISMLLAISFVETRTFAFDTWLGAYSFFCCDLFLLHKYKFPRYIVSPVLRGLAQAVFILALLWLPTTRNIFCIILYFSAFISGGIFISRQTFGLRYSLGAYYDYTSEHIE